MTLEYREIHGLNIKSFLNRCYPRRHGRSFLIKFSNFVEFCKICNFTGGHHLP